MKHIDLRSDTVTHPTPEMRKAMAEAPVGDDGYGDDPSINELEALAAQMLGKEAALFVPSGIFGNQLALFTHCPRGSEVILDNSCHIVQNEAGAPAVIAGVQLRTIQTENHAMIAPEHIETRIRVGSDPHWPITALICIENAHSSGKVFSLEQMQAISLLAQKYKLPVHLDGARIFNAACALQVPVKDIASYADSVMFCLSKGLCAPVGSMLVGTKEFIHRARYKRKIMGGSLRQAGVLAAAGIYAIKNMTERLIEDHKNADKLASELAAIAGIQVDMNRRDINMVFFKNKESASIDPEAFVEFMRSKDILISAPGKDGTFRFACHYWVSEADVDTVVRAIREFYRA